MLLSTTLPSFPAPTPTTHCSSKAAEILSHQLQPTIRPGRHHNDEVPLSMLEQFGRIQRRRPRSGRIWSTSSPSLSMIVVLHQQRSSSPSNSKAWRLIIEYKDVFGRKEMSSAPQIWHFSVLYREAWRLCPCLSSFYRSQGAESLPQQSCS